MRFSSQVKSPRRAFPRRKKERRQPNLLTRKLKIMEGKVRTKVKLRREKRRKGVTGTKMMVTRRPLRKLQGVSGITVLLFSPKYGLLMTFC